MIAHLDCSSGISGDKFLGALIDAGFSADELRSALASFGLAGEDIVVERVTSGGISATRIRLSEEAVSAAQPLRHLADIRGLVDGLSLTDSVKTRALNVFELLAEAEAHVHGTTVDDVHFHEIGALDTVLDVVGVALGLEALGIDRLVSTPLALGGGTAGTGHGTLPVPAPATARLLIGVPVQTGPLLEDGESPGELTTPTGAALVREFAADYGAVPSMLPKVVGYGAGTRDLGFANVARITIGEPLGPWGAIGPGGASEGLAVETVTVLETNVDHLTPEELAYAAEELLHEGALDVWQTPIVMKKGRAAAALSVMCEPFYAARFASRIHALTGTLGVRHASVERSVIGREERVVDTRRGALRVKVAHVNGKLQGRPEYDDIARIARETGAAFGQVAAELAADIAEALELE